MPVNPEGTNPGEELLEAFGDTEQQPTVEAGEDNASESEESAQSTEDEELEGVSEEDEAAADEGDQADEDTGKHTVKVNGEELKVSLQELKDGFMKDADYRRKTADLAETRKRLDAVETQFSGSLKTLDEQLTAVATFMANQMTMDDTDMDKLAAENPAEYVRVKRQLDKQGNLLQNVHNHLQNVKKAQSDEMLRKMEDFRKSENARLVEINPEFGKSETVTRLHNYLKETYGLSKEDIESVADHRFALIADKARRFDAMKAKAALKDKQVKKAPAKFQKGGAANRTNEAAKANGQAFKQVMSNGKVESLASLF